MREYTCMIPPYTKTPKFRIVCSRWCSSLCPSEVLTSWHDHVFVFVYFYEWKIGHSNNESFNQDCLGLYCGPSATTLPIKIRSHFICSAGFWCGNSFITCMKIQCIHFVLSYLSNKMLCLQPNAPAALRRYPWILLLLLLRVIFNFNLF